MRLTSAWNHSIGTGPECSSKLPLPCDITNGDHSTRLAQNSPIASPITLPDESTGIT